MAAKTTAALFFLAVAAALLLLAQGDSGFLLVHKSVDLKRGKPGSEKVTVSLAIHNAGSATAYDVSLVDDTWPSSMFNVVNGNTSATWEKLEVGKSLHHSFVLEPKTKGVFHCTPAIVKYRVASKSALQEALSTPLPALDLLADQPAGLKYFWLKKHAITYGPLAAVLTILGVFAYLLLSPSGKKPSKSSKKRR